MSSSPTTPSAASSSMLAAAERRLQALPVQPSASQLAAEHEQRQKFRRLIDPGIVRPNSKEQALSSLKTLSLIAENLLREPDNLKYQRFKPTNSVIKRDLMDPKGALEYAIELGFRPQVENFQPYYVFNSRRMNELKIGAAILKEHILREDEKAERAARAKQEEKAAAEAAAAKVKLAFMDDRRSKQLNDEREKELRATRSSSAAQQGASPLPSSDPPTMPGAGRALNAENPPSYETATAADASESGGDHDPNQST
ncbi:hypothetical protein AX16_003138 [Volvariella volvacea WC 439]|nr:hypothetical protein AX16_003138 [Volvariella volvacea WC 439]